MALLGAPAIAASNDATVEELLRRYPPTETNAAALDLDRLAAPLGIDLAPKSGNGPRKPESAARTHFNKVKDPLTTWLKHELERASGEITAPPQVVEMFLSSHAPDLGALRKGLLRGEPPIWAERLGQGYARSSTLPNLLGILEVQKLLVADALDEGRAGRTSIRHQDLEASWRLNERLGKSPVLIMRVIGLSVTRLQAGALRRLDVAPKTWRARLAGMTPVESTLEALRVDASMWPLFADAFQVRGPFAQIRNAVVGGFSRMCLEEASRAYLARLDRIGTQHAHCDEDFYGARDLSADVSWWNPYGNEFASSDEPLRRASRLTLEIEMTLKILDLRDARDANQGRWPDSRESTNRRPVQEITGSTKSRRTER